MRVSIDVLRIENVVLTDQNAASKWVRFYEPGDLEKLDLDSIYAADWTHPNDEIAYYRHKSAKCAEVLVYGGVNIQHIMGAYVISARTASNLQNAGFDREINIQPDLFFGDLK